MGLIDKLKNVFFEEVEIDDEEEIEVPKTYAKKVEVPKRKKEIYEEPQEEEEEDQEETYEEPLKEEEKETYFEEVKESQKNVPMMFDVDDFLEEESVSFEKESPIMKDFLEDEPIKEEKKELYARRNDYKEPSNPTYSYSKTSYTEEKQTKVFKPSPIISPIYGILDKNYRKEEVVTKRETRISGTYTKPDLDSVRDKAFSNSPKKERVINENKNKHYDDDVKIYDVNNSKPQVSKVTIADADEYYNDLGLAYNVDYSDASRSNVTRSSKYHNKEKKKEKKDVDDNLFDLIDSMYNKED